MFLCVVFFVSMNNIRRLFCVTLSILCHLDDNDDKIINSSLALFLHTCFQALNVCSLFAFSGWNGGKTLKLISKISICQINVIWILEDVS